MATPKTDYKFQAWVAQDETAVDGNLEYKEITPKPWDDDDIDVKVLYSGICGSDVSGLAGEFGPPGKDRVCGHEIVGEVVKAGSKVENGIKVGDIVGIGAQCDSCHECKQCKAGKENYCLKTTLTYGGSEYSRGNAKGTMSNGGFAEYWRGPSHFAIPIPKGLDPAAAAPLCCGGLTVYAPLVRYGAGTTAKNVGVVGIGGLGHMAIIIAKAMGANVTAISRGTAKEAQAKELGATNYIPTGKDAKEDFKDHQRSLDLIICTINPPELSLDDYLSLLEPEGTMVFVGVIPKPLSLSVFPLIFNARRIAGSIIGTPKELKDLLALAAEKKIAPWIEKWSMKDINKALPAAKAGKPKFRYVLVNEENGAKL